MRRITLTTLIALACVGCAPGASEITFSNSGLIEVVAPPLDVLPQQSWIAAPAGCEGFLDHPGVSFVVASLADGLVAAIGADGGILCVDTLESVEIELLEGGRDEEAADLHESYTATIDAVSIGVVAADPSPQPNIDASSPSEAMGNGGCGDPTPQPNTNPTPQPPR